MNIITSNYDAALNFWTVSFQYFKLVENVARETYASGNTWIVSKNANKGPVTNDELAEATRWSDHSLVIPLLFNLYHGIELLVKGFLLVTPGVVVKPKHSIQHLCREFSAAHPGEIEIIAFLEKYTEPSHMPNLLSSFLNDNAMTFPDLYQSLRYPSDQTFTNFKNYFTLKYKGPKGAQFFKELHESIKEVRPKAVRLGRSLETNAP